MHAPRRSSSSSPRPTTRSITVTRDGQTVGGTSIMGLMMLAAGPGSTLHISAQGPQGPEALQALVALVETGFGEDCIEDA